MQDFIIDRTLLRVLMDKYRNPTVILTP